jgi:hypothetical protein
MPSIDKLRVVTLHDAALWHLTLAGLSKDTWGIATLQATSICANDKFASFNVVLHRLSTRHGRNPT